MTNEGSNDQKRGSDEEGKNSFDQYIEEKQIRGPHIRQKRKKYKIIPKKNSIQGQIQNKAKQQITLSHTIMTIWVKTLNTNN